MSSGSRLAWTALALSTAFTATLVCYVHWQQFDERKVPTSAPWPAPIL